MIYVGLTKGIINATAHWYLAVTEDGTTFKNEDKDTLKEVLKCVEEMQKDTLKEVAICFDHWGASSWIAEIAEFVSKHEHLAYNGYVLEGAKPWVDSPKIGSYAEVKGAVINFDDIKLQEDCSEGETGYANLTALRAALVKACNEEYKKGIDDPTVNYTVNMVELANTVEYAEYKQLESVEVGDTITCRHKGIKIEVKARCIRIKWNCITKENEEVELSTWAKKIRRKKSKKEPYKR